jgi:Fe-S oxidoreductase
MLACPVFQSVGGHVFGGPVYPGGIGSLLTAMTRTLDESYRTLDLCSDCKKCEEFCPVGIPTGELLLKIKKIKGSMPWEKGLSSLFRSKGLAESGVGVLAVLEKVWQKDGHLRPLPLRWARGKRIPVLKPRRGSPAGPAEGPKAYLFQGCLVKYFFPEIRENVVKSLAYFGYRVVTPEDQVCCGAPSHHLGDSRAVEVLAKKNLDSFTRENPEVIITVCPTGNAFLKKVYPRLDPRADRFSARVQDFTAFMTSKGYRPKAKTSDKRELYYHYPCHYLTELKLEERPRELLGSLGFRLTEREEPPACCGFCGVFSVKNPGISEHLWKKKEKDIVRSRARLVATDCPGCLLQLRSGFAASDASVETRHTAEIFGELLEKGGPPSK